ncbi:hypothetical protein JB92DRAFT_795657 [Gautieria morchelliformis]|nr:hypothetical protein JB92DRAFT_795657 [Gautieria morchelliformis]
MTDMTLTKLGMWAIVSLCQVITPWTQSSRIMRYYAILLQPCGKIVSTLTPTLMIICDSVATRIQPRLVASFKRGSALAWQQVPGI